MKLVLNGLMSACTIIIIYTVRFVFLQMSNWEKCKIYIFNCIVAKFHCQEVVPILPRIFRLYLHFSVYTRQIWIKITLYQLLLSLVPITFHCLYRLLSVHLC